MELVHYDNQYSILCCRFYKKVFPWDRKDVFTSCWRLYWNPDEGAELECSGERYSMNRDSFYVIPAGTVFSHRAEQPFDHFFLHFSLNTGIRCGSRIFEIPATEEIVGDIRKLLAGSNVQYRDFFRYSMLADLILLKVLQLLPDEVMILAEKRDERIEKVCKYIAGHLDSDLSNQVLAKICGIEPVSFSRLFRSEIGLSPQYYIGERRIARACELFYDECYSIDEIAELTGFSNRYYFSRVFKKYMHISPAAFFRMAKQHKGIIL